MERSMQRTFLLVLIISLVVMLASVVLHNLLNSVLKTEEPVFFILAVFLSPIGIIVGVIGTIVLGIKGLFSKKTVIKVKKPKKK